LGLVGIGGINFLPIDYNSLLPKEVTKMKLDKLCIRNAERFILNQGYTPDTAESLIELASNMSKDSRSFLEMVELITASLMCYDTLQDVA